MVTVSALYIDPLRGPYPRMEGVDPWGWAGVRAASFWDRDATAYKGPHPVVAHPPCGPWGLFAWNYKGGEGAKSCGPRAVEQVRRWGGVLEHPQGSQLWKYCDLPAPGERDEFGGWTLQVQQVHWGHPCVKPTWLYIVGTDSAPIMPERVGLASHCMVRLLANPHELPELPKSRRHITPPAFARWLVSLAREART